MSLMFLIETFLAVVGLVILSFATLYMSEWSPEHSGVLVLSLVAFFAWFVLSSENRRCSKWLTFYRDKSQKIIKSDITQQLRGKLNELRELAPGMHWLDLEERIEKFETVIGQSKPTVAWKLQATTEDSSYRDIRAAIKEIKPILKQIECAQNLLKEVKGIYDEIERNKQKNDTKF